MHSVRYATTWSHSTVETDGADICTPDNITGSHKSTLTAINTAVLRPFAAYGARLRRIGFFYLDTSRKLVVEHGDKLAVTGRRHGLRLLSAHLLGGIIKWFANIGFGVRERLGDLACRFVA